MLKIVEYGELPLDDLMTRKGLTRMSEASRDIEELADSIRAQGLPRLIVVCESEARPE